MKVTLINTSDAGGGAPAACMRLLKALEAKQIDAGLDVQEKKTTEPRVTGTVSQLRARINLLTERLPFIWFKARDRSVRFAFSTANTGTDISTRTEILNADILHLHWTNFGFLSLNDIEQLFKTGKPIVWTLHDMWAFTGGCHYSSDCDHFLNHCGNCWMLKNPGPDDISHTGWIEKAAMYGAAKNIVFITCSNWLADVARSSSLLKDLRIEAIPNPIDTNIFSPADKAPLRLKWNISPGAKVILFGAANILDRRKGFSYLVDALNDLKDKDSAAAIEIVIFGKNKSFDVNQLPFKVHELGTINSEQAMAEVYNLADVFVNPTIEDNLPNTIMEALSCGVPVVAFKTGGVPDMVDHLNNGYLAAYKSSPDLAAGINWVFTAGPASGLAANARKKVLENFTGNIVASKYIAVYNSVLKK